mmetsp:Transcript_100649/g.280380  ORF Transcript_100649/g.280380 Transcript_100649/m.280380 type:complete len:91 (-) Transcript_100649:187-459(-)
MFHVLVVGFLPWTDVFSDPAGVLRRCVIVGVDVSRLDPVDVLALDSSPGVRKTKLLLRSTSSGSCSSTTRALAVGINLTNQACRHVGPQS